MIDAAHDAAPILEAINGRRVAGVVLTHGHNDHINAAVALADEVDAPIFLHPADRMLWDVVYPDRAPDRTWPRAMCSRPAGSNWACCTRPATPPAAAAS